MQTSGRRPSGLKNRQPGIGTDKKKVLLGEGLVEYLSRFIDSAPRKEIEQMNLGMLLAFQAEIRLGEWEGGVT